MNTKIPILAILLLLSSCMLQPVATYRQPEVNLPADWHNSEKTQAQPVDRWWESFGDERLNGLIQEAFRRNTDLAAATLSLKKARLQLGQAESGQLPGFAAQGDASYNRTIESGGTDGRSFSAKTTVSYEVDLWGRLSSVTDSARWTAQATEEDRSATALALSGTVAQLYWKIAYLHQRLASSQASIDYGQKTLELVRQQKQAGAVGQLELLEAERSLASQQASHESLRQQLTETRNALVLLFDNPPSALTFSEAQDVLSAQLPVPALYLPAEILARRPDMRAAEARLRASLAAGNAVKTSFYPTISLTGAVGGSSEDLTRILSNPLASLGAGLILPFIEWRDMQRAVSISEVEYEQAILNFRNRLYTSLAEVENSLAARRHYRVQEEKLAVSLLAARQVEDLYRIRYQAGASSLKSWLDTQEQRRQAEISILENRLAQIDNQINLCKALGGGPGIEKIPEK